MRLFIAIELDAPMRAAVVREQHRLAALLRWPDQGRDGHDDGGFRMVKAEQLHLTVIFLGEVSEAGAQALCGALAPPVATAPYPLSFGPAGVFPARGLPRVLWLGLAQGDAATRAVHADLLARVERIGLPVADRPFTPHLTLGRWRDGRPVHRRAIEAAAGWPSAPGPLATTVAGMKSDVGRVTMTVNGITLFHSRLSSAGPTYTPLVTTPLQCH